MVDGCTRLTAFLRIVLPAAAPGPGGDVRLRVPVRVGRAAVRRRPDAGQRGDDPDRHPQLHRQLPGKDGAADGGRRGLDPPRADRLLRDPALAREGHHRRGGEGMTATAPLPVGAAGLPAGFRFGAATAAYQIEGAAREDGRGESIWDRFSHRPGAVATATPATSRAITTTAGPADLDLMAALGLESYRFSIAWPRVQPDGRGRVEPARRRVVPAAGRGAAWSAGSSRSRRSITGISRRRARRPAAGRCATPRCASPTTRRMMADELGDVVEGWITHNEPWVVAILGHAVRAQGAGHPRLADRADGRASPPALARAGGRRAARAGRTRRSGSRST